ncbi:BTB/POZ domain-containing protein 7 [Scleropages formosus]|uniref:BTB (POZ) domain containing 7 n=1 Tax=Scleropages formosus TaxID=113540 RepID=A0A8C9VRR3_SCLFO|nr:BTB/POZ domain-containing protein 7 [Scleropages formosus]XP_029114245.1 BTB/POZ domain-containing protein 7 [Scleropages formosus]XP_029114246.1 BTB/POZ domain-containing protein 7 [Scleropages formosus]
MGLNASSYPHSCSPRVTGNSQAQQTFIGTSSYSQQAYGCEAKLYSLEQGPDKPSDKKKKSSGLATLKRRFIKRRKSSRSADHAKQMRELLSGWDVRDANALVEEYEGTAALKELSLQASLARPEARTLARDLAALYEHKYCTDVDLIFQDACFPVHRAILAARCPFFKTLLSSSPEYGAEVLLDVRTAGIDVPMFSALLRYLYTGELVPGDVRLRNVDVLVQLSEEFGTPNPLDADMRNLFDYMCYYDSLLSFSSEAELVEAFGAGGGAGGGLGGGVCAAGGQSCSEEELRAHKAVLSARSPFFRNLLQRRIRTGEEMTERTLQTPTRIVLDESIIPRKYARVILHCMYTDVVDLSYVLRSSPSTGSLGEVQALVAGKANMTRAEEAMELYHIALFLEFSMLAQGCEDLVVESLSLDSLVAILKWSSQPYGSKWVHRQALHFLCEDIGQIMTSDVLYELSKEHLLTAIQSDYLQASEQDILKYIVKWGEHQLIKRMADREPNLLSGTAHSVNKRGVKRRDLDIEELKEILSPLLPCVRIEHILPPNSEVLADAMKRGLISTPPSDMLPTAEGGKANAWLRQKSAGIYVRPRLFSPYVEEAKAVLDEMMVEQTDLVRLRMVRMSNVPDTLYMVNNAVPQCCHMISHQQMAAGQTAPPSVVANEVPVPKLAVVKQMIQRLHELRHTDQVQRAYALNCGEGATVSYEIQIRVLREFGLPDGAAELLQNPHKFFPDERFGDESPVLALRQAGRCRVNSTPAAENMFPDLEAMASFHPPLPPPPPPYHPPATPGHAQVMAAWRPRAPCQPPSRSFSYPCNHSLLTRHPPSKHSSPAYPTGVKALPPDCANLPGMARPLPPDKQGNMEPVISEFMPDIAMGVAAMSLKERRLAEGTMDGDGRDLHPHASTMPPTPHYPAGPRHGHAPCKKHGPEVKQEGRPEFPDLYDFSCRPATPAGSRHTPPPLPGSYVGPDLYSSNRPTPGHLPPAYLADMQPAGWPAVDSLRLDVLEQPPQRIDLALATGGAQGGGGHLSRGRSKNETDLTCGLGPARSPSAPDGTGGGPEPGGPLLTHWNSASEEAVASRDRRSPNKPEYPYRKSAL